MSKIVDLLGDKTSYYLDHTCKTIDKSLIYIPSPDTIDKVWIDSDRNIKVLNSLQAILRTRTSGKYRLCVHSSCRSGYRAYSRSILCSESYLFRSGEYCEVGYRRRL